MARHPKEQLERRKHGDVRGSVAAEGYPPVAESDVASSQDDAGGADRVGRHADRDPTQICPLPRMLAAGEVAAWLQVSISTVRTWTSERRIPFIKPAPKTVRYPSEQLLRWVRQEAAVPAREREHGNEKDRRQLLRRLQLHPPGDGATDAIPPFDWEGDHKAGS